VPQYDVGGVLDTNNEKYKGLYFNFVAPGQDPATGLPVKGTRLQMQLNGAYLPQYNQYLEEAYGMTRNSLPGGRRAVNVSLDQYLNNYCVQCFRLNMPDSEYSRTISGLDTRSVNLQGVVNTTPAAGSVVDSNLTIFTEQTETMRVGAGRSVEIIS